MDIKDQPNHAIYIRTLRQMSPEARLLKAFELSEFSKRLFLHGLHKRFPELSQEDIRRIYLERLKKCHKQELLKRVIQTLEDTGIQYMITGSIASSLQGEPRSTHDIDLVIAIEKRAADKLADAFSEPDFYLALLMLLIAKEGTGYGEGRGLEESPAMVIKE
ncbi:MAG: nucleotidyltransferase domain-containing protein [Nitrospirota bacterium]